MNDTRRFSERAAIVGRIPPAANAAATYLTEAIDMSKWRRVAFIVVNGTLGASATVDFSVKASATSGGSYAALTNAKAITQFVKATDDNKIAIVEVLDTDVSKDSKQFIKGEMIVGTAASGSMVIALGLDPRDVPVTSDDLSNVAQIV